MQVATRSLIALLAFLFCAETANASSLKQQIEDIFSNVLDIEIAGSPGEHGMHFSPNNVASSQATIDALSNSISASISNFSFSSTAAGVTYDLSSGVPERTTTSLGPIFAERAQTLGKNRINIGWNFSFLSHSSLRGLDTEDFRFTFVHQDVGAPGLGDSDNELDTIDLQMNLDINSTVAVFFTSYGVGDHIDVGFALPIINTELSAEPVSTINSFTFLANDSANHYFGGTQRDPVLVSYQDPIKDDAVGIGDILLRAKYHFFDRANAHLAGLLDVRLPTGSEEDFQGAGSAAYRLLFIASGTRGDFGPHANVGYNLRTSELLRDVVELTAGFDQKVTDELTFAGDFLARWEVGSEIESLRFPESAYISRPAGDGEWSRVVELTNLENQSRDDIYDVSAGFRFAPKASVMLVGNVIVPLNSDGLRSNIVPTIGVEFTL